MFTTIKSHSLYSFGSSTYFVFPCNFCMENPDEKYFGALESHIRALHTQDCKPMAIKLQALSLVEMAEPVQVRFTLRLRDQWSMWMQDGCQVYMDSNTASNGSCLMVTWAIFKNHLLEVGLNHDTPNAHDCWFLLFYHVWGPVSIDMHWNSIRLRVRSHMISHYNRGSVLHDDLGGVLGWPWDAYFWALTISQSRLLARVRSGPQFLRRAIDLLSF